MSSLSALTGLIRAEWISACQFHDLDESTVLNEVAARVQKAKGSTTPETRPLVLLDLDSTLYEVGPRTYRILSEWIASGAANAFPNVCSALKSAEPWHVGYSVRDTLTAVGLNMEDPEVQRAQALIKEFWAARFFTSEYLKYDHAYPGAAAFTCKVYELGAEVVYLTGRDEPGMGDGTRANLIRDGFPWDVPRTHLLMKKAAHLPDLDHKRNAAHYIRKNGALVASFENEPPNLIALSELFPDAMHVFVDTVYSDHPAAAREGLYRIKGFSSHHSG